MMRYISWIPPAPSNQANRSGVAHAFFSSLGWLLGHVLPKANPDIEDKFDLVAKWWLEVNDRGQPEREIGFDKSGQAIVLGPIGDNFGFVTDSPVMFESEENDAQVQREFHKLWAELEKEFRRSANKALESDC